MLTTKRLRMRPLAMEDLDDLLEIWSDPVAMRYYPATRTREELVPMVERTAENFARDRTGFYVMIDRETEEWIGQCGLLWQSVDGVDELEIGYQCKPRHWGKGYASEAAIGLRDFAFDELDRSHLISLVRPINRASAGVARKVGMKVWKRTLFKGMQVDVYRIDRTPA